MRFRVAALFCLLAPAAASTGCKHVGPPQTDDTGADTDGDSDTVSDIGTLFDPVSHWKFDEGSGSIAHDSVGTNDGTISGASWTTGIADGALAFDGNNHVEVGKTESLEILDEIMVEAWAYLFSDDDHKTVASNAQGAGWSIEFGVVDSGKYNWAVHVDGEYRFCVADSEAELFTWYHLLGTFDGLAARFYVNGVEQADVELATGTIKPSTEGVRFGANPPGLLSPFDGKIDEVRIYDQSL